jgi:Spy/CpxP family protein refolding chaperone
MKTIKTVSIAMLATLALATTAFAGPGGHRGEPGAPFPGLAGPGLNIERMAEHLSLDETQRQSIENILEAARPEFQALRSDFRANREALDALDPADAEYSAAINDIAAENGRLATQGTLLMSRVRNEVHAVLTEEQRQMLDERKQQRRGAMERRPRRQQQ